MADLHLTPFESTLLLDALEKVWGCRVVKAKLPVRRRVSIEEFEADMRAVRRQAASEAGVAPDPTGTDEKERG